MTIDLMNSYTHAVTGGTMDDTAVREAGAAGLQSLETLIAVLSARKPPHATTATADYLAVADFAVTKFKKFISLLDRTSTGHARFRRAPVSNPQIKSQKNTTSPPAAAPAVTPVTPVAVEMVFSATPATNRVPTTPLVKSGSFERKDIPTTTINFAAAAASPANSFISSLTGDTEGLQPSMSSGFQITNLSQVSSGGQQNLSSSSFKRKCDSIGDSHTKCTSSSGRCHCPKKKKLRVKRVVRVPAISLKMADIPPDDYSWRKYGQKPIKGSPHPRGYYKCSSVRGCPARKHVERALDDPSMLIVTYESEHNHSLDMKDSPATIIFESS